MRLNYYKFPENISEEILLKNGCAIILKSGDEIYKEYIPDDKRDLIDHIDRTISCSINAAKKLLKEFGGVAWTEHIDRDGSCFEVSEIKLNKNNSNFRYNHHL